MALHSVQSAERHKAIPQRMPMKMMRCGGVRHAPRNALQRTAHPRCLQNRTVNSTSWEKIKDG